MKAAAQGYVVVIQDVRGRYTSEGEWYPFKYESNDGYDTVEWAASLAGSDGRVGMMERVLRGGDTDAHRDCASAPPGGAYARL